MDQNASGGRKPPGMGEYLFAELRQAFQDIRQKIIEEGWFGRVVTAAPVVEVDHALTQDARGFYGDDHHPLSPERSVPIDHRPSFEELWRPREGGSDRSPDRAPEHDIGIDR